MYRRVKKESAQIKRTAGSCDVVRACHALDIGLILSIGMN
jgi:hypothetical protein